MEWKVEPLPNSESGMLGVVASSMEVQEQYKSSTAAKLAEQWTRDNSNSERAPTMPRLGRAV